MGKRYNLFKISMPHTVNDNDNYDACDGPEWTQPDWCETQGQIDAALYAFDVLSGPLEELWPYIVGAVCLLLLIVLAACCFFGCFCFKKCPIRIRAAPSGRGN